MAMTGYGLCFQGGKPADLIIAECNYTYGNAVFVIEALEIMQRITWAFRPIIG